MSILSYDRFLPSNTCCIKFEDYAAWLNEVSDEELKDSLQHPGRDDDDDDGDDNEVSAFALYEQLYEEADIDAGFKHIVCRLPVYVDSIHMTITHTQTFDFTGKTTREVLDTLSGYFDNFLQLPDQMSVLRSFCGIEEGECVFE